MGIIPLETLYNLCYNASDGNEKSIDEKVKDGSYKIYQFQNSSGGRQKRNRDQDTVIKLKKVSDEICPLTVQEGWFQDILIFITEIQAPPRSYGLEFLGRFDDIPIVICGNDENKDNETFFMNFQKTIFENWPEATEKIKFVQNADGINKEKYFCVFSNNTSPNYFSIYQEYPESKQLIDDDKFLVANSTEANKFLLSKKGKLKDVTDGKVDEWITGICNNRPKGTRTGTKSIMGCTANEFANQMCHDKHGKVAKNQYEWLHRLARSLVSKADVAPNLMCGTAIANSWMIIYETVAKSLCKQKTDKGENKYKVGITCIDQDKLQKKKTEW
eukprot:52914_1